MPRSKHEQRKDKLSDIILTDGFSMGANSPYLLIIDKLNKLDEEYPVLSEDDFNTTKDSRVLFADSRKREFYSEYLNYIKDYN